MTEKLAPGRPGSAPRWTSSAKSGVGTALDRNSRVWFTTSHGIVNEVYHPYIDLAAIRDLGLIVAADPDFFSEEKRDAHHVMEPLEHGVPAYRLTNTCLSGRYVIEKVILTDPGRDVLLQKIVFKPLVGELGDYRLYALLAPHIKNQGYGNNAWLDEYKGTPMLFAERDGVVICLACTTPWLRRSCGYVGVSDGWQQIRHSGQLTEYDRADDGNVALTGEVDLKTCNGKFTLALGLGAAASEAAQQAIAALQANFGGIQRKYVDGWRNYQSTITELPADQVNGFDLYRHSVDVLKIHEAKRFAGGLIASLSVPWGASHGDLDIGGYHVVWPRDQVEAAGALLAAGDAEGAAAVLSYLMNTQDDDGHWPQNMWLTGEAFWPGIQADETAFVILLADMLKRHNLIDGLAPWPAIRKAAGYLISHGPVSEQDRWEENGGFSPFTLATQISALLAAADFADDANDSGIAQYLRETADSWNSRIEEWTYVTGTDIAREVGVDGYYIRIAPPEAAADPNAKYGDISIKNRPWGQDKFPASSIVSPDALALVRFGLRAANDPRILNTIKVIDSLLKIDIDSGPVWHRYNHDGYGEHEDGSPYDGTGIGRAWPLLVGERAHYELAAGNVDEARRLCSTMASMAGHGGLLSEQVWDTDDIPSRRLHKGKPSGSAMPLVWAHAEYLKLVRSIHDGAVFDTAPQPARRYRSGTQDSPFTTWRFDARTKSILLGKTLRIEVLAEAVVRWTHDGWHTIDDVETRDTGIGIHVADLPTQGMTEGETIDFTFCWRVADHWEGQTFSVRVDGDK